MLGAPARQPAAKDVVMILGTSLPCLDVAQMEMGVQENCEFVYIKEGTGALFGVHSGCS